MENPHRFPYFDPQTLWTLRVPVLQVLRVVTAAGLAWFAAVALNLPQAHWAMISALVVVQDTFGATVSAGRDRILATGCGATLGAIAGIAHAHGWPAFLSWAIALVPAVAIANARREMRIAPVAAVIVASSAALASAPVAAALLRIGEISLGALVGAAASRWLFPSSTPDRMRAHAIRLISACSASVTGTPNGNEAVKEMRANRIRSSLREIAMIVRGLRHEDDLTRTQTSTFARSLRRLHEDLMLVERVSMQAQLQATEFLPLLEKLGSTLRDTLEAARSQLLNTINTPLPALQVDTLIPKSAPGIDDPRVAELKTVLRFAVKSLNRQLQAITAHPFNPRHPR